MATTYKIVIVGDAGCGKTTFITRHRTGEFEKKYNPTEGVSIPKLSFRIQNLKETEKINLNIWDCSGQEIRNRDSYYNNAHAFIIMFDLTSKISYKNSIKWYTEIIKNKAYLNQPILFCGNKMDCKNRILELTTPIATCKYYKISAKTNYNFEKPFLYLIRKLKKSKTITFEEL